MVQTQQNIPTNASVHSYFYVLHRSDSAISIEPMNPHKKARTLEQDEADVVKLTQQGGGTVYHYEFGDDGAPLKGPEYVQVRRTHAL